MTTPTAKKTNESQGPTIRRQRDRRIAKVPTHNDIAMRAYQLFVERGGEHGHDLDDWLLAQRELQSSDR